MTDATLLREDESGRLHHVEYFIVRIRGEGEPKSTEDYQGPYSEEEVELAKSRCRLARSRNPAKTFELEKRYTTIEVIDVEDE